MSCTTIPAPLMELMTAVATHPGTPVDQLDPVQYEVAAPNGWVYEYRRRVGLTGAGAWHAGMERRGGLLGDAKGPGTGPTPCVSSSVRSTSS